MSFRVRLAWRRSTSDARSAGLFSRNRPFICAMISSALRAVWPTASTERRIPARFSAAIARKVAPAAARSVAPRRAAIASSPSGSVTWTTLSRTLVARSINAVVWSARSSARFSSLSKIVSPAAIVPPGGSLGAPGEPPRRSMILSPVIPASCSIARVSARTGVPDRTTIRTRTWSGSSGEIAIDSTVPTRTPFM